MDLATWKPRWIVVKAADAVAAAEIGSIIDSRSLWHQLGQAISGYVGTLPMKRLSVPDAIGEAPKVKVIADKALVLGKTHEHKK